MWKPIADPAAVHAPIVAALLFTLSSGVPVDAAPVSVSASELFAFADRARDSGEYATAELAYRALASDPQRELRNEARFRLAQMLANQLGRYSEAAVELRRILDETPAAAGVRIELARIHLRLNRIEAARREFQAARAIGLPPEVDRLVRFYAEALRASRPFGGSIEIALAPDNNANRATRSTTLNTVLGEFALDKGAQARSVLGLTMRGQLFARKDIGRNSSLVARADGQAAIYRDPALRDISIGLRLGPDLALGRGRLALDAGPSWRWYGGQRYSYATTIAADWRHPLGRLARVQVTGGLARTVYRLNAGQTATSASLVLGYDRQLSGRAGGGLQIGGSRVAARDPGYSDWTGTLSSYAYREFGRVTAVGSLAYMHLTGDTPLALFGRRRLDNRFTIQGSATLRALQWRGVAPLVRLRWERNRSSLDLYSYSRTAAELGLTAAI